MTCPGEGGRLKPRSVFDVPFEQVIEGHAPERISVTDL
jgi:hypothetical protein